MPLKKEDFKLEELPEVYQMLSELVGIENMLKIAEAFGTSTDYLLGFSNVFHTNFLLLRRSNY